jgi:hypothetical protein
MSCANRTCSSTVVSSATMGLAMHAADRKPQTSVQQRGYRQTATEPKSKKIDQDVIPDTTRIDPKCVWGDEGPVNH